MNALQQFLNITPDIYHRYNRQWRKAAYLRSNYVKYNIRSLARLLGKVTQ